MPKRSVVDSQAFENSQAISPIKIFKEGDTWTIKDEPTLTTEAEPTPKDSTRAEEVVQLSSQDTDLRPTTYKPVSSGPKVRVLQTYILNYKPRVEAAISLNGPDPEVRFSSSEGVFYITGDEFLQLANERNEWPTHPVFLHSARLEPIQDGFRFARYGKDMSHDFFPITIFDMQKFSVKRLKEKLDIMSAHVFHLQASRPTIIQMFNSIVNVYREEYTRIHSFLTISEQANHLDRLVEGYTSTASIVRDFTSRLSNVCRFNHYNLCGVALAQKYYIHSLL